MTWWHNLPFFLIWTPLLLSSLTAALKPRAARAMSVAVPLAGTIASGVLLYHCVQAGGSFLYALGEFGAPYGNELRAGALEALLAFVFCLILLLSVVGGYKRIDAHIAERRQSLYCVMILLLQAGLMAQLFTNDVFTAYVFIEIMTIAAGALVVARTRGRTLFAATKYMIMNLLGSGLFLLGISVLYCLTGELLMESIHEKVVELHAAGAYSKPLILCMALITIGLAVKSALYPFHTWLPDAYASATPSSSAMLSSLVSKAYIFLYIKFVVRVFGFEVFRATHIQTVLLICSSVGIILGSIDAILEKKLRRMVAYSSVAQIGYIYLGVAIGTELGVAAAVFHIIAHAVTKSQLFLTTPRLAAVSGNSLRFKNLQGCALRDPNAGLFFLIPSLSMIGIPIFAGFSSKLFFALAAADRGGIKLILVMLALAASSLLNALYFIRTLIRIYTQSDSVKEKVRHHLDYNIPMAVLTLANLAMGLFSGVFAALIGQGFGLFY